MLKNFKLIVEYDGSAYHGWQRQKNERTVQGEIEKALTTLTGQKVSLTGSGRTDAGVHAFGQVASFLCDTALTPEVFKKGLNSLLPKDIVIQDCMSVSKNFHARYDAINKIYVYRILNRPTPAAVCRQYAWHIRRPLNLNAMRKATEHIVGTHDFKAFEGSGSPRVGTVRTVINAELSEMKGRYLAFEINN